MFKAACSSFALAMALTTLPSTAYAGTNGGTGAATFTVTDRCQIKGATVFLGSYRSNETWNDMANSLGRHDYVYFPTLGSTGSYITRGTKGAEYANWGSVTCSAGTYYSLTVSGPAKGRIQMTGHPTRNPSFMVYVRKVGDFVLQNNNDWEVGMGRAYGGDGLAVFIGTGNEQAILGSAVFFNDLNPTGLTSQIGYTGMMSGPVEYELRF